jgi:hypothetical protein
MTTRSLGYRLQRLEAKTGEAVRYVVVWEGMSEEEQAEFIRRHEAEHGRAARFLFVNTGVPRNWRSA